MSSLPYLLVLLGAILWGTTGTAQTFLPEDAHPFVVAAARSAIGGFALLIPLVVMRKIDFRNWSWKETILAALCIGLFQMLFFSSVKLTGVAIASVVAIGSAPVFSGLVEWFIFKQRPTRIWMVSTLFALVGCGFLFLNSGAVTVNPVGVMLSLGAGIVFAIYTMSSKVLVAKQDAMSAVAMTFSVAAILLSPFYVVNGAAWTVEPTNAGILLYLGIGTTTIAYVFYTTGLKKIPSSSALTLSLAEPTTAAVLGVLVVGEIFTWNSWVGIVLLLGSIVVLTIGARYQRPLKNPEAV
ncbi:DME family drug/metabolite transporter [Chryseomicrobium aureum]|uniref:DMT family transporter n=1 Tax=Chryseomicrobium aureum TaxID=1441723 RepID=UPI00195D51AE|nr:EamA family transporter [Chryseomicrobium aureum]MBM7706271.1 DME family drug/metabolite transporter [Chryseomicrobium aureum]